MQLKQCYKEKSSFKRLCQKEEKYKANDWCLNCKKLVKEVQIETKEIIKTSAAINEHRPTIVKSMKPKIGSLKISIKFIKDKDKKKEDIKY